MHPVLLLAALLTAGQPSVSVKPHIQAAVSTPTHSATVSWTASPDGGTVNIYRSTGTGAFSQLATGQPAGGPFVDTTISVGSYCYYLTSVVNGAESGASNQACATVLPQPPSGVAASAK